LRDANISEQQIAKMKKYDSMNSNRKSQAEAELDDDQACCFFFKKRRRREPFSQKVQTKSTKWLNFLLVGLQKCAKTIHELDSVISFVQKQGKRLEC
jgi:hypothetical protein